jgi:chaperonin GroEL (HSP60 family)
MAREGLRYIRSGVNPFSLGKGLHRAIEKLVSEIKGKAQQI